jgi:hypothetical protein
MRPSGSTPPAVTDRMARKSASFESKTHTMTTAPQNEAADTAVSRPFDNFMESSITLASHPHWRRYLPTPAAFV